MKIRCLLPRAGAPLALMMAVAASTCWPVGAARAVELIAHRGASHDAPENTLAAFRLAFQQGADGIEGDFYLSSDGKIVCIHDRNTKRTAGVDREVAQTTFADLRKLDVGSWKDRRFAGERIPTLREVLDVVPEGKTLLVEVKCGPELVPTLVRDLEASRVPHGQITVIAFNAEVIAACRRALPDVRALWLTGWKKDKESGAFSPSHEDVLKTLRRVEASGLDAQAEPEMVTAEFAAALRQPGFELHCWTVDDVELARQMERAGVQSITTNRPGWLREQLGAQ